MVFFVYLWMFISHLSLYSSCNLVLCMVWGRGPILLFFLVNNSLHSIMYWIISFFPQILFRATSVIFICVCLFQSCSIPIISLSTLNQHCVVSLIKPLYYFWCLIRQILHTLFRSVFSYSWLFTIAYILFIIVMLFFIHQNGPQSYGF